jgi:hypothetical protein
MAKVPPPANENPFNVSEENDHFPTLEISTSICMFSVAVNFFPSKKFPFVTIAGQAVSKPARLNTAEESTGSTTAFSDGSFSQPATSRQKRQSRRRRFLIGLFIEIKFKELIAL